MNLTIKEIGKLFDVVIEDVREIKNVEMDSRRLTAGDLFVPLAGTRDGHEFIEAAMANGAIATFWGKDKGDAPEGIVAIPVADTLKAMQQLAIYYRQKVAPKVVAITGSNGKTTTKDMTEAVLSEKFTTYKTQGNYNNEIGMPYTILHMPADCEMLILEMGMDHAGEIKVLSEMAQPDAAAITMIGEAHIENLGSREGIAKAKMEVTEGLKREGLLMIPADESLLDPLVKHLPQHVKTFGLFEGNINAEIEDETRDQTTFYVSGEEFTIPVIGSYNVRNALVAYGIGIYFDLTPTEIKHGLAKFQLTENRTQWLKAVNGADILSDVYNANPTAMALVLDTFANLQTPGRKLAVLADMLELGEDSAKMHAAMAEHINNEFAAVFLYGAEMKALFHALTEKDGDFTVYHFDQRDKREMVTLLKGELQPTDTILLKGSNGMGLADVVKQLRS